MGKIRKITACAANCFKLIHATKKQECENIVTSAKKKFSPSFLFCGKLRYPEFSVWYAEKQYIKGFWAHGYLFICNFSASYFNFSNQNELYLSV